MTPKTLLHFLLLSSVSCALPRIVQRNIQESAVGPATDKTNNTKRPFSLLKNSVSRVDHPMKVQRSSESTCSIDTSSTNSTPSQSPKNVPNDYETGFKPQFGIPPNAYHFMKMGMVYVGDSYLDHKRRARLREEAEKLTKEIQNMLNGNFDD